MIPTDSANADALIYGLPEGTYTLEETKVPEGYFPATAQKIIVKAENTTDKPIEATVVNDVFVKLGFTYDRMRIPAIVGLGIAAIGGIAFLLYSTRKRKSGTVSG